MKFYKPCRNCYDNLSLLDRETIFAYNRMRNNIVLRRGWIASWDEHYSQYCKLHKNKEELGCTMTFRQICQYLKYKGKERWSGKNRR